MRPERHGHPSLFVCWCANPGAVAACCPNQWLRKPTPKMLLHHGEPLLSLPNGGLLVFVWGRRHILFLVHVTGPLTMCSWHTFSSR